MNSTVLANVLLGPFDDIRRMAFGAIADIGLAGPPRTRRSGPADQAAARDLLTSAGCGLDGLTCENLHSSSVALSAGHVYTRFQSWHAWPRSGFLASLGMRSDGTPLPSYRFWGVLPVVRMHLFADEPSCHRVRSRLGIRA